MAAYGTTTPSLLHALRMRSASACAPHSAWRSNAVSSWQPWDFGACLVKSVLIRDSSGTEKAANATRLHASWNCLLEACSAASAVFDGSSLLLLLLLLLLS